MTVSGRLALEHICIRDEKGEQNTNSCLSAGGWNPTIHLSCHTTSLNGTVKLPLLQREQCSRYEGCRLSKWSFHNLACFKCVEVVNELLNSKGTEKK